MRATDTFNADVQAHPEDAAHRSGKPFTATLNDANRAGGRTHNAGQATVPAWPQYDLGQPLVELTKATALADELDDLAK